MWSLGSTPEPIEKIRKASWTVENTRKTQNVVNELTAARIALKRVVGNSYVVDAIDAAIVRFRQLDKGVKITNVD